MQNVIEEKRKGEYAPWVLNIVVAPKHNGTL